MGINPSNDGKNPDINDDEYIVPVFLGQDDHKVGIGFAYVEQKADGSLDVKLTLIGHYTMQSHNVPGTTLIRGFIPAALRKD